ncbi:hypothetical protein GCM10025867_17650 [Frondihabitans sucicola]|uniref:CBS domain-containing protein n=1 Tax=Frondihabitans sucicola TaxID=1268041 RepID=A0ABM8GM94_9MICO|nr:hypothetical protein GCM10025867_17650 [Frondihabitans sucicola]
MLARVDEAGHEHAVIVDERNRPISWPSRRQLTRLETVSTAVDPALPVVGQGATLNDALDTMLVSSAGAALVTGARDSFVGVITVEVVMEAITRSRRQALEAQDRPVGTNTATLEVVQAQNDPELESAASGNSL